MPVNLDRLGVNLIVNYDDKHEPEWPTDIEAWGTLMRDPGPQIDALPVPPGGVRVTSMRNQCDLLIQANRVTMTQRGANPAPASFADTISKVMQVLGDSAVVTFGYNLDVLFEPSGGDASALDAIGNGLLRSEVIEAFGSSQCSASLHYTINEGRRKLQLQARFGKSDARVVFASLNMEPPKDELPMDSNVAASALRAIEQEMETALERIFA